MVLWTERPQLFQTAVLLYWYSHKCVRPLGGSNKSIDDGHGNDDEPYGDAYLYKALTSSARFSPLMEQCATWPLIRPLRI
jgi:hypothetical protein